MEKITKKVPMIPKEKLEKHLFEYGKVRYGKTSFGMTSRKFGTESEKLYISKQDQKKIPKLISFNEVVNYLESKRLKSLKKIKKIKNKSARF